MGYFDYSSTAWLDLKVIQANNSLTFLKSKSKNHPAYKCVETSLEFDHLLVCLRKKNIRCSYQREIFNILLSIQPDLVTVNKARHHIDSSMLTQQIL